MEQRFSVMEKSLEKIMADQENLSTKVGSMACMMQKILDAMTELKRPNCQHKFENNKGTNEDEEVPNESDHANRAWVSLQMVQTPDIKALKDTPRQTSNKLVCRHDLPQGSCSHSCTQQKYSPKILRRISKRKPSRYLKSPFYIFKV